MAQVRKEFVMTQQDLDTLLEACKPVPMIALQCGTPQSQQERANAAWDALGRKMGFVGGSAQPCGGKSQLHFTAIPVESDRFTA